MEGSVIDLSKYRFESAKEDLETARSLIKDGKFKASVNRSYYAIFHSLRAVTALAQYDSSKHSGVIAFFNRTYVKEKIFDKSISKMIDTTYRLREKADYEDTYFRRRYLCSDFYSADYDFWQCVPNVGGRCSSAYGKLCSI